MEDDLSMSQIGLKKHYEARQKERSPVERGVGQALCWIDFKSEKEEIRLQLFAENLEQARKRAREIIGRKFKIKK